MASRHTEYYLHWCWYVLNTHGAALSTSLNSMAHLESIRALIRAVSTHEREIMKMSDENVFSLSFLTSQMVERSPAAITDVDVAADVDADDAGAESAMVVADKVVAPRPAVTSAAPAVPAAVPVPAPASEPVTAEEATSTPVSSKKSKKAAKKLTIQTGAAERESLLQSANSSVDAAAAEPASEEAETVAAEVHAEPEAEVEAVMEEAYVFPAESTFATPSRKKDKKSAKSASKSLLKTPATGGLGFDVTATGERRVSFSHPLSMVKIISPLSTGGMNTPQNSAKKGSKKRLWAEEEA